MNRNGSFIGIIKDCINRGLCSNKFLKVGMVVLLWLFMPVAIAVCKFNKKDL